MKKILFIGILFSIVTFGWTEESVSLENGQKLASVADVNGDNADDIIATNVRGGQMEISVYISRRGSFHAGSVWAIVRSNNSKFADSGDFNGDGLSDVLISYKERGINKLMVLYSTGSAFSQTIDSTPVVITPSPAPTPEPTPNPVDPYDNDLREIFRKALVPPFFAVRSDSSMPDFVAVLSKALQPYNIKLLYGSNMLFVNYRNRNHRIPIGGSELHKALVEVNKVIAAEFEIRYVAITAGSGKAGFVIRKVTDWRQLERQAPEHTARNYRILANMPDIFRELTSTDVRDNAYKQLENLFKFNSAN